MFDIIEQGDEQKWNDDTRKILESDLYKIWKTKNLKEWEFNNYIIKELKKLKEKECDNEAEIKEMEIQLQIAEYNLHNHTFNSFCITYGLNPFKTVEEQADKLKEYGLM